MMLFLITFLMLYGGMHCYAYIRFKESYRFSRRSSIIIYSWLCFTTIAPVLVRTCEVNNLDRIAKAIAWPGFIWMGFIFILVSILLTFDIIRLIAQQICRLKKSTIPYLLRTNITVEIAFLLAIGITICGYMEAQDIQTNKITIKSDKLSPDSPGIRVVQISDVHLGLIIREDRLNKMLQVVKESKPDILVSTGDLIDGRLSLQDGIKNYEKMIAMIAAVPTPLGKYAVTGNHEYFAGLQQSLDITEAAGFKLLRNSFITLPNGITISGIDDPAWKRMLLPAPAINEEVLLKSLPTGQFHLHLKHRPTVPSEVEGLFDLQLSGHTHRGQIFPFYLLTKYQFPIPSGTTNLKNGTKIHVSNGTGTWGPPIRFLAPPEVTIIDIIPTKALTGSN